MKLFTDIIEQLLQEQYKFGNDLKKQQVIAKIFNPYGKGTWYLLNQDPEDPDYLWAIVDLDYVEIGSVAKSDLEEIKVPPFNMPLERDTDFEPVNAKKLFDQLTRDSFPSNGRLELDLPFLGS